MNIAKTYGLKATLWASPLFEVGQPDYLGVHFFRQVKEPRRGRIANDQSGKATGTRGLLQEVSERYE